MALPQEQAARTVVNKRVQEAVQLLNEIEGIKEDLNDDDVLEEIVDEFCDFETIPFFELTEENRIRILKNIEQFISDTKN